MVLPIHKGYPFRSGLDIAVDCLIHSSRLMGCKLHAYPLGGEGATSTIGWTCLPSSLLAHHSSCNREFPSLNVLRERGLVPLGNGLRWNYPSTVKIAKKEAWYGETRLLSK
jgi:hypothetical protein